jgi:dynein heavy chain
MDSVNIDTKLEVPVLVRSESKEEELPVAVANNPLFARSKKNGILESNFDSELHRMLIECQYWTIIQAIGMVNIPHNIVKLLQRKDQLRVLRENVMLIVRDYNNIIVTIDEKERSLFKEHLDMLDRTIDPGIKRHNWGSNADNFVYACRKECQDVFLNVKKFQNNNMKINQEYEKISRTTLTNVQKKLYILTDFIR